MLDDVRPVVLARYGAAVGGVRRAPLGSAGGFSGASVWRGEDESGRPVFALKAWPPDGITRDRLAWIHGLIARAGHLPFAPAVLPTTDSSTAVTEAGRVWDLARWMPGVADFHTRPTPTRLANASAALALLHRTWTPPIVASGPCPGVERRLRILSDWQTLRTRLGRPGPLGDPALDDAVGHGAEVVARLAGPAERALRPWASRRVAVRPCLCDVRHDHVLFTDEAVTGVIDFGAAKDDHVGVDLARLLGELIGDDEGAFAAGLDAYRAAGGPLELPAGFVRLLDRTGIVCAVAVWLFRLAAGARPHPDPRAVAARLAGLATRLDGLSGIEPAYST